MYSYHATKLPDSKAVYSASYHTQYIMHNILYITLAMLHSHIYAYLLQRQNSEHKNRRDEVQQYNTTEL